MSTFSIELKGFAASAWGQVLYPPHDPYLEVVSDNGEDLYLLHSTEFDGCTEAVQVLRIAVPLVRLLSAVMDMYFEGVEPLTIGAFIQERTDKGEIEMYSVAYMMHGRKRLPFIETDPDPYSPSVIQAALAKVSTVPPAVMDAIEHFSAMPVIDVGVGHTPKLDNWHDLYKAYEALGKVDGLVRYGIQRKEAERFSPQAQHFRHHKTTAPNTGMSLDEAKALIISALRNALSTVTQAR
ncbi:hypothetical protein [Sinorhizobium medicae]|uniref:hypothetical protein n=1 Tax=Sinorhizobium medicae TaxID=110321 RepID=UPI000C7A07BA|nr:hypothetical protein [Sinorhizobium medicae]MDX1148063.1 hypothetical protein [Sinorhizobium medicae]PLU13411.1 hypothetical protein BMJ31_26740 [Sinorhizobium medicae]PLU44688.1 hypothetical protein BMJ28_03220 [Sinorhizobium medicae]PLU45049.1 hypothetical protein BMJ26_01675 [Sinorhizobium medicae]PLU47472.1 hypothetical protein BMJ24_33430 [Sinorhizobium medicae]